jgi:hypothetical protein
MKRQAKRAVKRRERAWEKEIRLLRRQNQRLLEDNDRLRRIVQALETLVHPRCSARSNGSACALPQGHRGEHFSGAARWED